MKAFVKASCQAYATQTIEVLEALGFTNCSFKTWDFVTLGFRNLTIRCTYKGVEMLINPTAAAGHWYVGINLTDTEERNATWGRVRQTTSKTFRVASLKGLMDKISGIKA